MFLQNILQQRLQQLNDEEAYLQQTDVNTQNSQLSGGLRQPNKKIGSVHNGKVNYSKDQTFFTANDINHNVFTPFV